MRVLMTLIVILSIAIAVMEKLPPRGYKNIPHSEPTPVEMFMEKVAHIESSDNYRAVNTIGMMGRYQFSPRTVRGLGYVVTREEFLSNPHLQDSVMFAYMKQNHDYLKRYIDRYDGKVFKGIKVTRAGIVAGAHFAGPGGILAYFGSSDPDGTVDIYGMSLRKYMRSFSDVNLPEL